MDESKTCRKCGRVLPVEKFRLVRGQLHDPYYLNQCKECEYKYQRAYLEEKNKVEFPDGLQILVPRQYKEVNPKRVLDVSHTDIVPLGEDEIFVRLMDYKDAWLSNYGRAVRYSDGRYSLLQGSYDAQGALRYSLKKNVFLDGRWTYKRAVLYAAKAVIEEFIVNPDRANNVYIWHRGYDRQDCYYKHLYPVNQEQYRIVRGHYRKTGDAPEEFIVKSDE